MSDVFLMVSENRNLNPDLCGSAWFPLVMDSGIREEVMRLGLCSTDTTYPHKSGLRFPTSEEIDDCTGRYLGIPGEGWLPVYFKFPVDKYGFRVLDPGQFQTVRYAAYPAIHDELCNLFSREYAEVMGLQLMFNGYHNPRFLRWLCEIEFEVENTLLDKHRILAIHGNYTESGNSATLHISSDWFEVRSSI